MGLILPGTSEWRDRGQVAGPAVQQQPQPQQQQAARRRPRGQRALGGGAAAEEAGKRQLRISWAGSGIYFW
jgi:hypothetical protein